MSNAEELKTWHVTQILYGSKIETRIVKARTQAAAEGDLFDSGELQDESFDLDAENYETYEIITVCMDEDLAKSFMDDPGRTPSGVGTTAHSRGLRNV